MSTLWHGPNGQVSAARVLLTAWLVYGAGYVIPLVAGAGLVAWQVVCLGLLSWAGGQHVTAAIAPALSGSMAALSAAVQAEIAKRRASSEHAGAEPTP